MTAPAAATAQEPLIERLEKLCVTITRPIAFIGVTGMLIAAGVTVLDVLMRWLAGTAITALNEITALIFAVAVAACMPAGLAGGVNLRIDLLARWLTGRVAAWLDALGSGLLLVFFFILAWRIGVFAEHLLQQGRTTVILRLPQAPFMYAVAILLAIGTLVQAAVTARAVARASRHEAHESPVVVAIVMVLGAATLALCAILLFDFAAAAHWASQHIGAAVAIAFIFMWILMFAQVPLAAVMGVTGIVGS